MQIMNFILHFWYFVNCLVQFRIEEKATEEDITNLKRHHG